jgi:hypothetical protein
VARAVRKTTRAEPRGHDLRQLLGTIQGSGWNSHFNQSRIGTRPREYFGTLAYDF